MFYQYLKYYNTSRRFLTLFTNGASMSDHRQLRRLGDDDSDEDEDINETEPRRSGGFPVIQITATSTDGNKRDHTKLGIVCVCFCFMMCIIVAAVSVLAAYRMNGHNNGQSSAQSPREDWMKQHARLLKTMGDASADPCEDFFQSVCGQWLVHTEIPPSENAIGTFDTLQNSIDQKLLIILRQQWPFVSTWFDACEDVQSRAQLGIGALRDLYQLIDELNDTQSGLAPLLANLHLNDVPALFSVWFQPDERNISRPSAMSSYPLMGASVDVWNSTSPGATVQRAAMLRLMTDLLGDTAAERALSFERDWLVPRMMNASQHYTTPYSWIPAQPNCAGFSWRAYWGALVGNPAPEEIGMRDTSYLAAVCDAVQTVSLDVLQDYLRYSVTLAYVDSFPNASALLQPLRESISGVISLQTLDEECLRSTEAAFPFLLGHYFSQEFFTDEIIARAQEIWNGIARSMERTLALTGWIDDATRAAAQEKLASVQAFIGHPLEWSAQLPGPFVFIDDYLSNVRAYRRTSVIYNIALWTNPAYFQAVRNAPPAWQMPVFQVNAEYVPTENMIVIPEAIIGGVFFNESAPDAANYGSLGAVMGHELTHGFDSDGRHYDAQGNRRDWWTAQASEQFDVQAQCIVDLYGRFETPYGRVDGTLTEGENIADSGGLALALGAYRDRVRSMTGEKRDEMRALIQEIYGFSDEQLFFRSYATTWCTKRTPARAAQLLHADPHSPPRARVNNVVGQSVDFLSAFSCPSSNETLCKVW